MRSRGEDGNRMCGALSAAKAVLSDGHNKTPVADPAAPARNRLLVFRRKAAPV